MVTSLVGNKCDLEDKREVLTEASVLAEPDFFNYVPSNLPN